MSEALDNTDPIADLGGASVVRQGNGSSAYSYGYTYHVSAVNSSLRLGAYVDFEVAGNGLRHGCSRVSTLGLWDEEVNWDTGVVPGLTDEARKSNFIRALSVGACTEFFCVHVKGLAKNKAGFTYMLEFSIGVMG